MTDDLIERLRTFWSRQAGDSHDQTQKQRMTTVTEAADTIASLRKQLEDARSLPTDDGWEDMVEPVARRLCEKQIRHVRRHDTDKEWLDANMEECVDYSWQDHIQQARTALEVVFGPLPAPPSE